MEFSVHNMIHSEFILIYLKDGSSLGCMSGSFGNRYRIIAYKSLKYLWLLYNTN